MLPRTIQKYQSIPFCKETPQADFYAFLDLSELAAKREAAHGVQRCRALGVLHSHAGRFYLSSISDPTNADGAKSIMVSMAYMKTSMLSTVMPYPVQIFGFLHWEPDAVLFANIIQNLPVRVALHINDMLMDLNKKYVTKKLHKNVGCDQGS